MKHKGYASYGVKNKRIGAGEKPRNTTGAYGKSTPKGSMEGGKARGIVKMKHGKKAR